MDHKVSQVGKEALKFSEGVRETCYYDSKGLPTIGVGHLIKPTEQHLLTGRLTMSQVDEMLTQDLAVVENWINAHCKWSSPINQNEFDALANFLFQYNIDSSKYTNTRATIISGNRDKIAQALMQFVNITAGKGDQKLLPRRIREIKMFRG